MEPICEGKEEGLSEWKTLKKFGGIKHSIKQTHECLWVNETSY